MIDLPETPGTYALLLILHQPTRLRVGKLGEAVFAAAAYVYVGSAFGPGGLRARLGRHLRGGNKAHWHIDHLRRAARLRAFCYTGEEPGGPPPLECRWSQALAAQPQAWIPLVGFGASDCRAGCRAHLVAFPFIQDDLLEKLWSVAELDGRGLIFQRVESTEFNR